jgi:hypothetical protein
MSFTYQYPRAALTVDCVVFRVGYRKIPETEKAMFQL